MEDITHDERMGVAALDYFERGFAVVPTHVGTIIDGRYVCTCGATLCGKSAGKHPAVAWRRYQIARAAESQLCSWMAGQFRGYNVGAVHGRSASTIVLDWDGEDGRESCRHLEWEFGPLPLTPTIITGSGGEHQVFRHPGRHIPTNKGLRPGFDVRGDGGFSVLPPSRHYLGRRYEWDVDLHIEDIPLADLPEPWIEFIATFGGDGGSGNGEIVWTPAPDGTSLVSDGRETFMRDCIWRAFCTLEQRLGRSPTPEELVQAAAAAYLPAVDLRRAGRGEDELRRKCQALLARKTEHLPLRRGLSKQFLSR